MSQGCKARLFSAMVPTPFVAIGVSLLVSPFQSLAALPLEALPPETHSLMVFPIPIQGCAGGIMITASHNPKEYNGLKVYGPQGVQIIPPTDAHIAEAIEQNLDVWDLPTEMEVGPGWRPPCSQQWLFQPAHRPAPHL